MPAAGRCLDRQLSPLRYAVRLMGLAEDRSLPLIHRLEALQDSGRTLDAFFQFLVPQLKAEGEGVMASAIRGEVEALYERQALFQRDLMRRLGADGIEVIDERILSKEDATYLAGYFQESVFPLLTPLAVDPGHPFLRASQLSLSLAMIVRHPLSRREHLACLKVPPVLPRLVALPDGERILPLERVVVANLRALFPGMEIVRHAAFRLTCDSQPSTLRDWAGEPLPRPLSRFRAVRLEVNPDMPDEVRNLLVRELLLTADDVYVVKALLDLGWAAAATEFIRFGR